MEELQDLRMARMEGVDGDRIGTEDRANREWHSGREAIPREYQPHFREEYGTTLTDSQYKALNKNQEDFTTSVDKARTKITDTRAEVQKLYEEQNRAMDQTLGGLPPDFQSFSSNFSSSNSQRYLELVQQARDASWVSDMGGGYLYQDQETANRVLNGLMADEYRSQLMANPGFNTFFNDWASKNAVKVYVIDPKRPFYNDEYWVLPDTAASLDALDLRGYGDVTRASDGTIWAVSDTYAAQIKGALDPYRQEMLVKLGDAYVSAINQSIETGRADLQNEYNLVVDGLDSQGRIIDKEVEYNTLALSTIRTTYANKLNRMSETIGAMPKYA